jgi:ribosomal protein S8
MYDIQKSYMRKTYFVHTPGSDIDSEMRKFQWLFKQGFISEVELQQMRATMVTSNMVEQLSLKSERILH